ncbi:phosphatidylglycerophosphatase A [Franzmannia qiaohouensis]|uniref:Phosphatidylglycerophosphatase A n=1 Tax=Franzmannia qiaohouensis TaxID=1329370 RepID=A0ABU1HJE4_9GAMM|nr:phosphatidylglycerophosphatase A [Halomonas qiaohouensis]MDR5907407.1 phosphatidylglycerophosphatase A [Halomonas qiaohouensis]
MLEGILIAVGTGFGLGTLPLAPGTFGSLLGLPLAWWLLRYPLAIQATLAALLVAVAIPLCHYAALAVGGGDPSQIVADEFLLFPLAVLGLQAARNPWVMASAFLLFRLFDILKPPPIHWVESWHGGLGIVADDALAALCTWVVMAGLLQLRRWQLKRIGQ